MNYTLYAGMNTGNDAQLGIHRFAVDTEQKTWTPFGVTPQHEPQFVRLSPDRRTLYAVWYEGEGRGLCAYRIEPDRSLTRISHVSCRGAGPNYLRIDSRGRFLLSANYRSGNLVVTRILPDGSLGETTDSAQHCGHGPNPDRQEKPHVHIAMLSDDDRYVYACDLGIDKIMIYRFDGGNGTLAPAETPWIDLPAGEGPRHIAIHPDGAYAYLVTELGNRLFTYARSAATGALTQLGAPRPLTPAAFTQTNYPSEILVHPNGQFLYQLNRGHDSVGVWSLRDPAAPEPVAYIPSGGATPRQMAFSPDAKQLFVANQDGCTLAAFDLPANGIPSPWPAAAQMPRPMCIAVL